MKSVILSFLKNPGKWQSWNFWHPRILGRPAGLILRQVPPGLPSRGGDVTVYKHKRACPLPSVLFLWVFLSLCPFQLYFIPKILPTILCLLTLLFFPPYFCLIGPFKVYISLYESLHSPDIIHSGWLVSKHQLTKQLLRPDKSRNWHKEAD